MKRIMAVILAILTLMPCAAALGESLGTRLELESVRLYPLGSDNDSVARFHGMTLTLAVGSVEGMPTLQATLGYGDGQELDGVLQLTDDKLLMCMGGISAVYYVDLDTLLDEEGQGALIRKAVEAAVGMFALNPKMVLDMAMPKNERGVRKLNARIPRKTYRAAAKQVLKLLRGMGETAGESAKNLRELVKASKKPIKLAVQYNADKEKLVARLTRAGQGLRLKAKMKLVSEPMEFINLTADPTQLDLMNLTEEEATTLRDELDFLSMKYGFFAKSTHLDELSE